MGISVLLALVSGDGAHGDEPLTSEERGSAITEILHERTRGFERLSARLHMTLENRRGQTSDRTLRFRILERTDGGLYSLCLVDAPPDVRGTALLSHAHPAAEDQQWLFMPAAQRTRRIAGGGRSGSFMGSEFSYEDLTGTPMEGRAATWLRDEILETRRCHVVAYVPSDPRASGYSRQIAWIDQEDYRLWKVEYYNPRNERMKTLTFSEYQRYGDRYWQAHRMDMVNHLTGNRTRLVWSDLDFEAELDPADFDRQRLPFLR